MRAIQPDRGHGESPGANICRDLRVFDAEVQNALSHKAQRAELEAQSAPLLTAADGIVGPAAHAVQRGCLQSQACQQPGGALAS